MMVGVEPEPIPVNTSRCLVRPVLAAAVLATSVSEDSAVGGVIFDTAFSPTAWSFSSYSATGASGSATRIVNGGPLGAGNALSVDNNLSAAGLGWAVNMFSTQTIDLAAVGGITDISVTVSTRMLIGSNFLFGLAISQGGTIYRSGGVTVTNTGGTWSQASDTSASMFRLSATGPTSPDFSAGGSVISVGFFMANSNSQAATYTSEFADFLASYTPIPVPAPAVLPVSLVAGIMSSRRRRRDR